MSWSITSRGYIRLLHSWQNCMDVWRSSSSAIPPTALAPLPPRASYRWRTGVRRLPSPLFPAVPGLVPSPPSQNNFVFFFIQKHAEGGRACSDRVDDHAGGGRGPSGAHPCIYLCRADRRRACSRGGDVCASPAASTTQREANAARARPAARNIWHTVRRACAASFRGGRVGLAPRYRRARRCVVVCALPART